MFIAIQKLKVSYINERGVRRTGIAYAKRGDIYKIKHKAGYYERVHNAQFVA